MIRLNKFTLVLVALAVGAWGCSKSAPGDGHDGARVRVLEAKIAKLEEDVRTAQAARDHVRLKLTSAERECHQACQQVRELTQERTDLRQQVSTRTTERDAVQTQYETFRKEIKSLLGQAEAATLTPAQPVTAGTAALTAGKS